MTKRVVSMVLAVLLFLSAVPALAESLTVNLLQSLNPDDWPVTMWVYTENKGKLNVRNEPKAGSKVLEQVDYGSELTVLGLVANDTNWAIVQHKKGTNGIGYVMTRYLANHRPSDTDKVARENEKKKNQEELDRQQKSFRTVAEPFMIAARPARASGWVNFRNGPGVAAARIDTLPGGRELKVIGETDKWWQAVDMETGTTGFVSKNYVTVLAKAVPPEKQQMGKLNVNGEFTLQCLLPEGYSMQMINSMGTAITAFISSQDAEKPILQLSIVFDELYADVDRMNDLTDEDLKILEDSFTEMNDVDISYLFTSYGTKLLVAKEVGDDTDFVDFFSVYKGYSIEFVMTVNPQAKNQALNDTQIQMCVDFLSELDFVGAM
ncbi:MAG: SH3 domain-containing protein [Clostridia bacterium]|nr:SH3 domain-containing protein [Clostridia bacterium]